MLKTTRRNKEDREVEINDHTNNNRGIKSNSSVKIILKAHGTPLLLHPSHLGCLQDGYRQIYSSPSTATTTYVCRKNPISTSLV